MEALLTTPEIRDTDLAALVVRDQPMCRIQKASRGAALLREDRIVLAHDSAGRPVLTVVSPASS